MTGGQADPCVFIGCRIGDPHQRDIPGKRSIRCARCHLPTLFAPSSFNHPNASHPRTLFVCVECAAAGAVNGLKLLAPSAEQVDEVVAAGYGPDAFAAQGQQLRTIGYRYVLVSGLWHLEDPKPGAARDTVCGLAVLAGTIEAFCTLPNPQMGMWAMRAAASDMDPTVASSEPCEICFPASAS